MPITFYSYLLAAGALVGLPLFSGFLSKDAILSGSWAWAQTMSANGSSVYFLVPLIGFTVVLLTAYYMGRHMWFIFFGSFRLPFDVQALRLSAKREVEGIMMFPVILLALLSLGIFFSFNPLNFSDSWVMNGISLEYFINRTVLLAESLIQQVSAQDAASHATHLVIGIFSALLGTAGVGLAIIKYRNVSAASLKVARQKGAFAKIAYQHFYLDQIYNAAFVRPVLELSRILYRVDKRAIDYTLDYGSKWLVVLSKIIAWFDRLFVDGTVLLIGTLAKFFGRFGRGIQNGKVQSYYAYSLFGFILIILYIVLF